MNQPGGFDKVLLLLRGLPGSGKSTLAHILSESGMHPVFSIDEFFISRETGAYNFDHKRNHLAYDQCREKTEQSMTEQLPRIIVDHTFTMEWEMEPYLKLASEYRYTVFVMTVENYHGGRNVHGISEDQMKKMADKYKVRLLP